jgi:hypothetical protein
LGNHDYHYLGNIFFQRYSGFQQKYFLQIHEILEENMDLLKVVYVTGDNYLISHAGVSVWYMNTMASIGVTGVEGINDAFTRDRDILTFNGDNPYGDDITQSPIWIRPHSLERQPLPGYNQIVGHTEGYQIKEVTLRDSQKSTVKIAYIDTGDRESIYLF